MHLQQKAKQPMCDTKPTTASIQSTDALQMSFKQTGNNTILLPLPFPTLNKVLLAAQPVVGFRNCTFMMALLSLEIVPL
jgi:hypothetical protein